VTLLTAMLIAASCLVNSSISFRVRRKLPLMYDSAILNCISSNRLSYTFQGNRYHALVRLYVIDFFIFCNVSHVCPVIVSVVPFQVSVLDYPAFGMIPTVYLVRDALGESL